MIRFKQSLSDYHCYRVLYHSYCHIVKMYSNIISCYRFYLYKISSCFSEIVCKLTFLQYEKKNIYNDELNMRRKLFVLNIFDEQGSCNDFHTKLNQLKLISHGFESGETELQMHNTQEFHNQTKKSHPMFLGFFHDGLTLIDL